MLDFEMFLQTQFGAPTQVKKEFKFAPTSAAQNIKLEPVAIKTEVPAVQQTASDLQNMKTTFLNRKDA